MVLALSFSLLTVSRPVPADVDWFAVTVDNDSFVGEDNGYTNGLYFSWFDAPQGNAKADVGLLASLMKWSLPQFGDSMRGVGAKSIGQTMITPDDIEQDPPILPPDDLPYGGLLYYRDAYFLANSDVTDMIAVTIGVVGEYSFAEEAQKGVHKLIDSAEPCCWDEQLDDEVVFELTRGRIWRTWASDNDNTDFLFHTDLVLGTMSSSAGVGLMVRYGRNMQRSYPTAIMVASRIVNPIATREGWYVYASARAQYLATHIFLDGSKSYDDDFEEIDYENSTVPISVGGAYAWKEFSLTFAVTDLQLSTDSSDASDDYTRFGTLTAAFKLD